MIIKPYYFSIHLESKSRKNIKQNKICNNIDIKYFLNL